MFTRRLSLSVVFGARRVVCDLLRPRDSDSEVLSHFWAWGALVLGTPSMTQISHGVVIE